MFLTRRRLVATSALSVAVAAAGGVGAAPRPVHARTGRRVDPLRADPFTLGVASGEPTAVASESADH
ncbi:hypothetical protein [Pilimelia columellifera]|uniref:Uncharacterized protein n=1 Tax=Pilimelia columellifera subsp. columellifera TaxID=706583 RepID=A0ABP6ARQ3_9ACTN